ncbi:transposase [Streptomyces sp. NPDC008061]|uniref:transposase n=1 Tax=Streptomyces sp. NPDC008061 TaxID=3364805 RepID=UPI0036EFFE1F
MGSKSNRSRRYTEEFKRDAVALVRSSGKTVTEVAREIGVIAEGLRNWVKQDTIVRGQGAPGELTSAEREDREAGRGRRETRSVRTSTITDLGLDFPHAVQAAKILRHRTDIRTGTVTRQTVYAIADMTAREASPQAIGRLARSQWEIEALHHVSDVTFTEDAAKIRAGRGREHMATLRNFAITTLRAAGHPSIAAGLRETSYAPFARPLDLLDLT